LLVVIHLLKFRDHLRAHEGGTAAPTDKLKLLFGGGIFVLRTAVTIGTVL